MAMNDTILAGESVRETVQAPVSCALGTARFAAMGRVGPQAFVSYELIRELLLILDPFFEVKLYGQLAYVERLKS